MIVSCVNCGKETYKAKYFYEKAKGNVFCSIPCFQESKKKKRINLTCRICGKVFSAQPAVYRKYKSKYCGRKCADIAQHSPVLNPRFKQRDVRKCLYCKKEFEVEVWRMKYSNRKVYCDEKCRYADRRVEKIERICLRCSSIFHIYPSQLKYSRADFCSKKCGYEHNRGENHPRFKNATSENERIRKSAEYKRWRTSVFIRDNRQCVWCSSRKDIEADHIKPFSLFPELALDLSNGRTLCHKCHETTESYMNPYMKKEDFLEAK